MLEDRRGGTVHSGSTPDGSSFFEGQDTRRLDAGAVARALLGGGRLLSIRGSGVVQTHEHRFGDAIERDRHWTTFMEASLAGADAVLLAAALVFILTLGVAPAPPLRLARNPHLRPPLRGPPLLA